MITHGENNNDHDDGHQHGQTGTSVEDLQDVL